MKITLMGAAGEVTGSSYLIQTSHNTILLDFGMHQGGKEAEKRNYEPLRFDPSKLDAVILTHAHFDHCGRLPLLLKGGFRGRIMCTGPTIGLANLILQDAAFHQQRRFESEERRTPGDEEPENEAGIQPLYTAEEATDTIALCQACDYEKFYQVGRDIEFTFRDAGHILGAASVALRVNEGGKLHTIIFSADIGQSDMPILNDPGTHSQGDLVFLESTYGDRDHRSLPQTLVELEVILKKVQATRGRALIPAFAVGRTQQLLYHIAQMAGEKKFPAMPVFIDSPMAIRATQLYQSNPEMLDEEAENLVRTQQMQRDLPGLAFLRMAEQSKELNTRAGPFVVIAGAGMCNGGRILHHLKHHLSKSDTSVIICGFQAEGSLGRRLVERQPMVRIHGDPIPVHATIHTLNGFSAHAGQTQLLDWFRPLGKQAVKPKLVLSHGEDRPRKILAARIQEEFGITAQLPQRFDTVTL